MSLRNACVWRWIVVTLLIALSAPALISQPSTQINKWLGSGHAAALAHDGAAKKTGLSCEQLAREAWIWHEINRQRLKQSHALGAEALTTEIPNQDTNDISVIVDDGRFVIPPNPFDLSGRAVQFDPAGSGYAISAASATFDTSFGAKLDLTTAPAVNPKLEAEPGDDAYILQDLGFNFSFFGATFSSVAVGSNGNLSFRPTNVSQSEFNLGAVSSIASSSDGLHLRAAMAQSFTERNGFRKTLNLLS